METLPLKVFTTLEPPLDPGMAATLKEVKILLKKYCGITSEEAQQWLNGAISTAAIAEHKGRAVEEIAQHVCFAITKSVGTAYVWGMAQ